MRLARSISFATKARVYKPPSRMDFHFDRVCRSDRTGSWSDVSPNHQRIPAQNHARELTRS